MHRLFHARHWIATVCRYSLNQHHSLQNPHQLQYTTLDSQSPHQIHGNTLDSTIMRVNFRSMRQLSLIDYISMTQCGMVLIPHTGNTSRITASSTTMRPNSPFRPQAGDTGALAVRNPSKQILLQQVCIIQSACHHLKWSCSNGMPSHRSNANSLKWRFQSGFLSHQSSGLQCRSKEVVAGQDFVCNKSFEHIYRSEVWAFCLTGLHPATHKTEIETQTKHGRAAGGQAGRRAAWST